RGAPLFPAARGGMRAARRTRSLKPRPSSRLPTRVRVQGVVHRKLSAEPLVIRESQHGEPLRDRSQTQPFRSNGFLSADVCSADNSSQSLQSGIGQMKVLENRLKGATITTMIERHFG